MRLPRINDAQMDLLAERLHTRAGRPAAGFALGAGTGVAAIFAASLTYGLYGFAIAAGSGAFLLVQVITGRRIDAGATFTLSATGIAILIAAADRVNCLLRRIPN